MSYSFDTDYTSEPSSGGGGDLGPVGPVLWGLASVVSLEFLASCSEPVSNFVKNYRESASGFILSELCVFGFGAVAGPLLSCYLTDLEERRREKKRKKEWDEQCNIRRYILGERHRKEDFECKNLTFGIEELGRAYRGVEDSATRKAARKQLKKIMWDNARNWYCTGDREEIKRAGKELGYSNLRTWAVRVIGYLDAL